MDSKRGLSPQSPGLPRGRPRIGEDPNTRQAQDWINLALHGDEVARMQLDEIASDKTLPKNMRARASKAEKDLIKEEIRQEIRNTPVWVIMGPDPYDHNSQRQAIDAMREARDQTYALKIVREIEESRLHSLINLIYEALDIGFPEVTRDFVFRAKGQLHYPTSDWLFKKAYRNDEINAVSGLFDLAYSDSFNFILDEPIQVRSLIQIIIEGLLPSDILIELREQVQLDDQISRSLLALIDANI